MNRSLRAAGGVLATAAIVTSVLITISLLDPQATEVSTAHDDSSGLSVESATLQEPLSLAAWQQLDKQLGDLENRLDDHASRRNDDVESTRRQLGEVESRLREEVERGLGDEWLLETIKTTLAQRGDQQRLASIETRLKTLTGTIEREVQETATLREAIGRLQPVLDVSADSLRPGRFTIAARRVPLREVLKRVETLSDWKFTTTGAVSALVSIDRLDGVTLEQALEVLLPAAGCAARLEGRQVSVMSLAEARHRQDQVEASATPDTTQARLPGQHNDRGVAANREVILEVTIASIELTDEFPRGIRDLVERIDPPRDASGGVLLQSVSGFLEQLAELVSIRILARQRLRVVSGEVARLETDLPLTSVAPKTLPGRPEEPDAVTRLMIRPRIVSQGRIELEIVPSQVTAVSDADKQSSTQSTRVVLAAGRTVLFGGSYGDVPSTSSVTNETDSRRPRLFERFFGSRNQPPAAVPTRRELIVLVTPRLVDQRTGVPLQQPAR